MSDTDIELTIKKYLLFKKRPQSEENDKDILYNKNLLINYCKNFYFFSNKIVSYKIYNIDNILPKVIDQMHFHLFRKDTNIWKIGDNAENIYIIFIGEVNIFKPPEKKDNKIIMELDHVLGKGNLIGGECLKYNYNFENKKTYLAKAKTKCILGKINAKEFIKLYKQILSEENNLLNNFLKDLNVFSVDFNGKFLKTTSLKYYKKDEYIFQQGDLFDTFYLIYNGNVRLCANMKKLVKSKFDFDLLKGNNTKERFTTSRQFEIKGFYNELNKYNLLDVGKGDFIGGIEYLNEDDKYNCNAKCITDVAVLKIDLNQFNTILINKEKKVFKAKIEMQEEFLNKRMKEIKSGQDRLNLDDYVLSKNKFVKTFLQSNPLTKKAEEDLDSYINCNVNPIKVKYSNKNIKIINTSINLLPKYIIKYKKKKPQKKKWKKPNLEIKDFVTNIDYKKQVKVGNIFPMILFEEQIPNSNKEIYKIKNEDNKTDKKVNTEPLNQTTRKNFRSFTNINKNKLSLKQNKNGVLLTNEIPKGHLFLDLRNKIDKPFSGSQRKIFKYYSFRKNQLK